MHNADVPNRAELPTTAQLIKATIIAIIAAIIILVTIVLPAEYAIDPTGVGRALRLTEMGEIKQQLAAEAEADRIRERKQQVPPKSGAGTMQSATFGKLVARLMISPAAASEPVLIAQAATRADETIITLRPADGVEYKMTMIRSAQARYSWRADGGVVNYDMHGSPAGGGKETSYKAARGVSGDEGVLTAGFDGAHGWFWRNRGAADITITLRTSGAYSEIRRAK